MARTAARQRPAAGTDEGQGQKQQRQGESIHRHPLGWSGGRSVDFKQRQSADLANALNRDIGQTIAIIKKIIPTGKVCHKLIAVDRCFHMRILPPRNKKGRQVGQLLDGLERISQNENARSSLA